MAWASKRVRMEKEEDENSASGGYGLDVRRVWARVQDDLTPSQVVDRSRDNTTH
jgi:hypothetical protein